MCLKEKKKHLSILRHHFVFFLFFSFTAHILAHSRRLVQVKPLPRFCEWLGASRRTWLEGFERQSPLRRGLRAVVLHDGHAQEARLLEVHGELEVLVPHGVEGVAVDGLGAEVAAVDGHAQNVHLDAGAAGAVAGTHVLAGDDLEQRCDTCGTLSHQTFVTWTLFFKLFYCDI